MPKVQLRHNSLGACYTQGSSAGAQFIVHSPEATLQAITDTLGVI